MEVSVRQTLPHDEFQKRFGPLAGAGYDDAHAALLRAQGIKPVSVSTTYGADVPSAGAATPATETVPTPPADLTPLYGLFISLADELAALKAKPTETAVFDPSAILEAINNLADRIAAIEAAPRAETTPDLSADMAALKKHLLSQEEWIQGVAQSIEEHKTRLTIIEQTKVPDLHAIGA